MAREFEIRRDVDLPASPEEVWEAVATGPGTASWLFPNEIEQREGATNPDGSTVKAWDPPRRFAVRVDGDQDWFNALEFTIEGREDGGSLLRYVHSGIFVQDWENQYDAANNHTDFYLHTLGEYLRHFGGRTATYVGTPPAGIQGPATSARPGAFDLLREELGLGDGAAEGDFVSLAPSGLEPIQAVVDYLRPHFIGLRTDDGMYRFFGRDAWGMPVGMGVHLFGQEVDAAATEQVWKRWLDGVFD
jgi:uncharacterized protein YndB with AHSA1/START domain